MTKVTLYPKQGIRAWHFARPSDGTNYHQGGRFCSQGGKVSAWNTFGINSYERCQAIPKVSRGETIWLWWTNRLHCNEGFPSQLSIADLHRPAHTRRIAGFPTGPLSDSPHAEPHASPPVGTPVLHGSPPRRCHALADPSDHRVPQRAAPGWCCGGALGAMCGCAYL
jgi:hypothetical protein